MKTILSFALSCLCIMLLVSPSVHPFDSKDNVVATESVIVDTEPDESVASSPVAFSPYISIEKNLLSNGDLNFPTDNPFIPDLIDFEAVDMISVGLHVRKNQLFVNCALAAPWYNNSGRFNPCLDISTGINTGGTSVFGGLLVELSDDCETQISNLIYGGVSYSVSTAGPISTDIGMMIQTGSPESIGLSTDKWYHSVSLTARAGYNSGPVNPYVFATAERWYFNGDASNIVRFGIGLLIGGITTHPASAMPVRVDGRREMLVKKPNIYLYPSQASKVDVYIAPNGKILTSIPDYNTGWHVIAQPDGSIPNTDGFLFYEADVIIEIPEQGWSVSRSDLRSFFEDKLQAYGFNDKEIREFVEYWTVKLPSSQYYTIYPLLNDDLGAICPLTVVPEPDNVLRLWFVFEATSNHVVIEPPIVPEFDRSGFVVTEWGGIINEE